MTTTTKTALVTGASSSIGEATALKLIALGYTVYGAARRTDRLRKLAERGVRPLAMDVTDDDSMRSGVDRIVSETGRIDVLVNNAGYGSYGALEDVSQEEARRQFDVNVFGAVRLTQIVLPHMRALRSGTVVNVTSMGGKIYTPLGGWYHGTKFALEALSDCLRMEVRPFGIDVVVIEPGGIRTEWSGIAADHLEKSSAGGAYSGQAEAVAASMRSEAMVKRMSPPTVIADAVGKAVTARRPRTRYATGFGARPLLALRRVLPDRAFDAMMARSVGLPR
ncbi:MULTISPECIES: oxidoreductase [Streptomyces]|uniref:oxidoreductase n=1 Tax=Streptomyces TaxID=1883 RepID=UPI00167729E9|nr:MULTISPECIES: oxidoreductase [Streptomyces]MBK3521024.1 oxidoreductase [Streptomyces sp. MBT70]GGS13233.1 short-chain dehydrogenase/reductase [Streptomyces eurythermus]